MHVTLPPAFGIRRLTQRLRWRPWLPLAIILWLVAVGLSWRTFLNYDFSSAGASLELDQTPWPTGSALTLAEDRPTVLFFMHPKCPCTRASLAELERLWVLRDEHDEHRSPRLIVVATVPGDASADWLATDTLRRAQNLAGAAVTIDPDGREAQRFGATTSGTIMWFTADGSRLYGGGITASRGHEGENVGFACVAELLRGRSTPGRGVPALGCGLCLPPTENPSQNLAGK